MKRTGLGSSSCTVRRKMNVKVKIMKTVFKAPVFSLLVLSIKVSQNSALRSFNGFFCRIRSATRQDLISAIKA